MKCPAGHDSTATDYCDTCGVAMPDAGETGSPAATTDPAPPDGAAQATSCPNCQAPTPANALFCESCGYDFTTGAMPRPMTPPSGLDLPPSHGAGPSIPTAEPVETATDPNPSPAPADAWVAEVWIDPDWYADQQSTDPLPSPGLPSVVALRHTSVLIGRASRSRGIAPDIDLGTDNGISRRHAQLTTDGSRWFVEDLGSSNGTYVGGATGLLPKTPIPVGQKTEIAAGDRVYLGAWTRIVVRQAAPGEV
ncbi:FHA domain-containing protein [Nocardioides sp. R-C-SC26]|uniref:FHA domain-containing protein n=1 Tax=Nocardioides sp. R-C-SC26 TaxID=2870414 RepID=UPI001E57B554|nr:FHA domain-containing protein [Nocardioides sp. R-C-SC26]